MSSRVEPDKKPFGSKSGGRKPSSPDPNIKLPSQQALDFLTQGPPAQQRIMQFGRLTPIGAGSPTFGAQPRAARKKDGF